MADDKSKKDRRDRDRVAGDENYEVLSDRNNWHFGAGCQRADQEVRERSAHS